MEKKKTTILFMISMFVFLFRFDLVHETMLLGTSQINADKVAPAKNVYQGLVCQIISKWYNKYVEV